MNRQDALFSAQEFVLFQMMLKEHLIGAAKAPLIGTITGLQVLVLLLVGYVEYEIIYRVFDFLSGDNNYWSPEIMGLTAAIMIIGFHIQAHTHPGNFAVRFVTKTVQYLIPVYMVGVGLLIASILDVGSIIDVQPPVVLGQIPDVVGPHWIDRVFTELTNPLAALAFSLGLGGLAIVNIFVAHHLLGRIWENTEDLTGRVAHAKQALADYAALKRAHHQYAELGRNLTELLIWDDQTISMNVAGVALQERDEALRPHKEWLTEQRLGKATLFEAQESTDPQEIARLIKPIEAISLKDILTALTPPHTLENRR